MSEQEMPSGYYGRHYFLAIILFLLAGSCVTLLSHSGSLLDNIKQGDAGNVVVGLMLLFNHL